MFSKQDLVIESQADFISFLLITPFVVFVSPFLIAAYTLGFLQDLCGWID